MQTYFVRLKGKVWGPFSLGQLKTMQGQGRLSSFHEVSADRQSWTAVSAVPELATAEAATGPAAHPVAAPVAPSDKFIARPIAKAAPVTNSDGGGDLEFTSAHVDQKQEFRDWEAQMGWGRVRTGITLLMCGCGVAAVNFLVLVVGGISALLGESSGGLLFTLGLFQLGRAISVLLEVGGTGFCATVPIRSGARGIGIAAFAMNLLYLLVSAFPSYYVLQMDLAKPRHFPLNNRELAGIGMVVLLFFGISVLAWIGWNLAHLYFLEIVNRSLARKRTTSLPLAGVFVFLGAVILTILTPCLLGAFADAMTFNHPANPDRGASSAIVVLLVAGLAACLWVAFFVVYFVALWQVHGIVKEVDKR